MPALDLKILHRLEFITKCSAIEFVANGRLNDRHQPNAGRSDLAADWTCPDMEGPIPLFDAEIWGCMQDADDGYLFAPIGMCQARRLIVTR